MYLFYFILPVFVGLLVLYQGNYDQQQCLGNLGSLRSLIVMRLMLRSFIYFDLISVDDIRKIVCDILVHGKEYLTNEKALPHCLSMALVIYNQLITLLN